MREISDAELRSQDGGFKSCSRVTYLDNAATSWPKPEEVYLAVDEFMRNVGANPGRSGHRRSVEAARVVFEAREAVAELINAPDPSQVVFAFNATDALNMAVRGVVRRGDHVITTSMEHNSVMRPLRAMAQSGFIDLTVVQCDERGLVCTESILEAIRQTTSTIVMTHASNVVGTLLPVEDVAREARSRGVTLIVDAAQSCGVFPMDVTRMKVDLLAASGHKGLLGPQGTGFLYVREGIEVDPFRRGGTGSLSEQDVHPDFMPDRLEAGTHNTPGLAGLGAGVRYLIRTGVHNVLEHERSLCARFMEELRGIAGVRVYGPLDPKLMVGVVSISVDGVDVGELAHELDQRYGIMVRPGLHCAPVAHRTIGTYPTGTVRFSFGWSNTAEDVDYALNALELLVARMRR